MMLGSSELNVASPFASAASFRTAANSSAGARPDTTVLGLLAAAVSFAALAHYYRWSQILLSGDAVAHINIARRVFDSRTPGPTQLGTVWLPLQHVLTIPFVISGWMWSSGIGGAIPSMFGYVLGVIGVYRLVQRGFAGSGRDGIASVAAWVSAVMYAANPNLIYVQTTALNEALAMALFVWTVLFFTEFWRAASASDDVRAAQRLAWCGWLLMAGMLIRYDAWFHGVALIAAAAVALAVLARRRGGAAQFWRGRLRKAFLTFVLLSCAAPAAWMAYNAAFWGSPLEFATGPYSARAIEQRSRRSGDPHYPGWRAPYVAAEYYVKSLQLNLDEHGTGYWDKTWVGVAVLGSVAILLFARGLWPWLLLWLPLPFYAISIAWGGVPIFIPAWWPFSYYNTRYALQLLPAVTVFWGAASFFALTGWRQRWIRVAIPAVILAFTVASYASVWRRAPLCLREVRANGGARYALDGVLGRDLARLPANATLLMYLGEHGGALQRGGIPLRRTINEGNKYPWKTALRAPAAGADFIIATEGDAVAHAVQQNPAGLALLAVLQSAGQKPVKIYGSLTKVPADTTHH